MNKNPFSLHVNMGDFLPATEAEKAYMVQMRPSTTFFKDGMKRLFRNKIATPSLIIIVLVTLSASIIPSFWPYSYDAMLSMVLRNGSLCLARHMRWNSLFPLLPIQKRKPSPLQELCWMRILPGRRA